MLNNSCVIVKLVIKMVQNFIIYVFYKNIISLCRPLPTTLWCASFKIWPVMKGEIDIENYAIKMILYTRTCLPYVIFLLCQVQTASFRLEYAQTQLEIDMLSN